ncbi:glycosyltransferase family 4 protein [Haoranjiania flava]|uniref:Glycosyltransferase family 4 protein n=1 Tax=Haoranjiania flava TaxID=1856322 RepID=A0AAE3INP1_9BACT|nr:glycosyltransferase family 1 protein [Haoranjiania flava]MCU7694969.1 glycosyltransferase family 4 protein [Haoranjiania flava]
MKIAINCWILRNKNVDGIGNFCIQTVQWLAQSHPEDEFLLLCDKNFTENYFDFPNTKIHRILPPYRHPLLYIFYMETVVKYFLSAHKPDVFIGIEGFLSLGSKVKQIPVIHDLNFEHYPHDLPWRNRMYYRRFFPLFASKATRISTVSTFTKNDIVRRYAVPENKIDVVFCGIKEKFRPLSQLEIDAARSKYSASQPYFFFIGSMHPRKNLLRLIEAFDVFREKNQSATHKLILAGSILWDDKMFDDILKRVSHRTDIIFTGRVSDEELIYLLGAATALTFVPTFEGFGLPIVEAFQAEVPVVCSNVTSMPEVAGDAAIIVDPFNITEIATAMALLANDGAMRKSLIEKGKDRRRFFSWQQTAYLLYASILKTVNPLY